MTITIAGSVASGKSTLARMLAEALNLPHYNFDLIYRAIAVVSNGNLDSVIPLINSGKLQIQCGEILFCNIILTAHLRNEYFGLLAAQLARYYSKEMAYIAKFMVAHESFVCDGRMCGTEIYPNADYKFYIKADKRSRFQRRFIYEEDLRVLARREKIDQDSLIVPEQAIVISTTGKTEEESLQELLSFL